MTPEPRAHMVVLQPVTMVVKSPVSSEAWETELYVGGIRAGRTDIGYALAVFAAVVSSRGREVKDEWRPTKRAQTLRKAAESAAEAKMLEAFVNIGRSSSLGRAAFEHHWGELVESGVGVLTTMGKLPVEYRIERSNF